MRLRQVHDVDIVPQAGPVRGRVVIAEHREAFAFADGGLGDEGHQVVGHAARQLADQRGGVRPDGVEIAQRDAAHARIGLHAVAQDILAHLLGVAVGRGGRLARRGLRHGELVRLAVDRRGGGEQHVATLLPRSLQDVDERQEVVAVVHQRLRHGLAHRLEGGEMDHRVDGVFREERLHGRRVAEVHPDQRHLPSENGADALVVGLVAIGEIVRDHHVIARLGELHGHVAADESGAAGD